MNNCMIDLETMGSGPSNVAVVQFGGVFFDPMTGETGNRLTFNISLEDELKNGFVVTANTIEWWLMQNEHARRSITRRKKILCLDAWYAINTFLAPAKYVWSHAMFDFVIVMEHFRRLGLESLVSYRAGLDIRTLLELCPVDIESRPRVGVHHNAIDDCIFQVGYVSEALRKLTIRTRKGD